MVSVVRRVLDYQMTIAEWIGTALLLGAPHLVIGVVWTLTDPGRISHLDGLAKVAAFFAAVVLWPVLLISGVCTI